MPNSRLACDGGKSTGAQIAGAVCATRLFVKEKPMVMLAAKVFPPGLTADQLRKTIAAFLPAGVTAIQLRKTTDALLEVESQISRSDPNWREVRMVRRLLGRIMVVTEVLEKGEVPLGF